MKFIKELIKKIYAPFKITMSYIRRTIFLKNTDFSIISNNCWGGRVYQRYNLKYSSPTIGLYFMAEDYIKFLKNLKYYLNKDLNIININESKHKNTLLKRNYNGIIGKIDDIEIMFLHYRTPNEAIDKWNRRKERINWDNLIVKFNDQNNCKYEHIMEFDKLKFKNKICFSSKDYKKIKSNIFMSEYKNHEYVKNDVTKYKKYIKIDKFINEM